MYHLLVSLSEAVKKEAFGQNFRQYQNIVRIEAVGFNFYLIESID